MKSIIAKIYFYLVSLIGLMMIVIPTADLIQLGLKTWIFKNADINQQSYSYQMAPYAFEKIPSTPIEAAKISKDKCNLTDAQKAGLDKWIKDYETWQEEQKKIDYVRSDRERRTVTDIGFLAVGIPLFFIHFRIIRKERDAA